MAWGQTQSGQQQQSQFSQGLFDNSKTGQRFNSALGSYYAAAAPQYGALNQQNSAATRDFGFNQLGLGYDQNSMQLNYQGDINDLQTQTGQNQIDMRAAARQPGLIDQLLGSQNRDFDISRADLGTTYAKNTRDLNSDATARGAYVSGGVNKDRKTLYEQLLHGMQHIDESQTQNTLNAQEQKAQANDRMDALNLTAKNLGMKPQLLLDTLNNGLAKLGLSNKIDASHLLDGIAQNDLQAQQITQQIVQQAGQYAVARGAK